MEEAVRCQREGAVFWMVLNRPETLNAMNMELIKGMKKGIEQAKEGGIRCVVLSGAGRGFCAGGDIRTFYEFMKSGKKIAAEMPDVLHEMIEELRGLEKPVLAVIHGPAAGAGTSLALACDLVLAADDTKFNLAYAKIGLSPDGSSSYFLPRHVGLKKATEIFMLCENLTAQQALEVGLINWVVPAAELEKKAREIAARLAAGPTKSYGRIKKLLNVAHSNGLHAQLALETRLICESSGTEDFKEGITAFLEKRPAQYRGR